MLSDVSMVVVLVGVSVKVEYCVFSVGDVCKLGCATAPKKKNKVTFILRESSKLNYLLFFPARA